MPVSKPFCGFTKLAMLNPDRITEFHFGGPFFASLLFDGLFLYLPSKQKMWLKTDVDRCWYESKNGTAITGVKSD